MFDVERKLDVLLATARRQEGDVFIGVVMSPSETTFVLAELHHAYRDASSWVVGGRQRKKKSRKQVLARNANQPNDSGMNGNHQPPR